QKDKRDAVLAFELGQIQQRLSDPCVSVKFNREGKHQRLNNKRRLGVGPGRVPTDGQWRPRLGHWLKLKRNHHLTLAFAPGELPGDSRPSSETFSPGTGSPPAVLEVEAQPFRSQPIVASPINIERCF